MADAIKVRCPQCGELLRIPKASLDQKIQCRTCSKSFRAAAESSAFGGPDPTVASRFADGTGGRRRRTEFQFR